MMKLKYQIIFILSVILTLSSCSKDDDVKYVKREIAESTHEVDAYLKENFLDKHNCAIRWKWDDKFVSTDYYVTPCLKSVVVPVAKMITDFWINPYEKCSEGGRNFIHANFPPEIVFIGSEILNENGTTTLGFAEAGVRITLSELDQFDLKDIGWLKGQLHTIHHEFTHIVHQQYKLPVGYEKITGSYTGNSWGTLVDFVAKTKEEKEQEALTGVKIRAKEDHKRPIKYGCVTAYATNNEFEDFCELVSTFLLSEEKDFIEEYFPKSDKEINDLVDAKINELTSEKGIEAYVKDAVSQANIRAQNAAYEKAIKDGKTKKEAIVIALKAGAEASAIAKTEAPKQAVIAASKQGMAISKDLNELNEGKAKIKRKYDMAVSYYKNNFDIDINVLRDIIQERIANAQK